jgi:hypothetical protein
MLRRSALGVLAALALAGVAAAVQPAAAAPSTGYTPTVSVEGTSPAVAPLAPPAQSRPIPRSHSNDMCPPPANYAGVATAM